MSVRILQGDCREVMASLPECSVDAIVTDPPYELTSGKKGGTGAASVNLESPYGRARIGTGNGAGGFMGMKWDATGVAFDPETWRQALRVLKPGGYLLAFSGTRTYHRMACAIEDAGFEVRDQLGWVYASGFPKSLNLDNERGKSICGCQNRPEDVAARDAEPDVHGVRPGVPPSAVARSQGQDAKLQPAVQRGVARSGVGEARAQGRGRPEDDAGCGRAEEPGVEGRSDAAPPQGQLCLGAVRAGPALGASDGAQGRVRHGAQAADGGVVRLPVDADRGCASRRPQPAEQLQEQSGTLAGQPQPQAGGAWPVCGGCGLPVLPRGLGTALKPAWEPVCMARKPLAGTVAANVLQHGTGALNIDGCRVLTDGEQRAPITGRGALPTRHTTDAPREAGTVVQPHELGRWPANILHDGSDEVVAAFPSQAGASAPVRGTEGSRASVGRVTGERDRVPGAFHGDTGSAARFFWSPKASRSDRNEGLGGMPAKVTDDGRAKAADNAYQRGKTERQNHHPTVKPTDLMRYLCRLVTPPGGVVLDPFMGSGSTLKAAELEGFSAIGIELSAEYIAIARRRIAADAPLFADVKVQA